MRPFDLHPHTQYHLECWRPVSLTGVVPSMGAKRLIWDEDFHNLVVTVGKNKLLDACFKTGGEGANAWFVGLVDSVGWTAYASGDTMASHAGWAESVAYSETIRQAYVASTPSGGACDNVANRATFTMNATKTIQGAFLTDNNTKSGTTGTLYGVGDFTQLRNVIAGDQIFAQVTITL